VLRALALILLSGCASTAALDSVPAPEPEWSDIQTAWADAGYPPCPGLELWIYETDSADVHDLCRNPKARGCLLSVKEHGRIVKRRWVAVVDQDYPGVWPHEGGHALEHCAWGRFDYAHVNEYWPLLDGWGRDAGL
jgi:hypothetical protein